MLLLIVDKSAKLEIILISYCKNIYERGFKVQCILQFSLLSDPLLRLRWILVFRLGCVLRVVLAHSIAQAVEMAKILKNNVILDYLKDENTGSFILSVRK